MRLGPQAMAVPAPGQAQAGAPARVGRAGYAATLTITVTVAVACVLLAGSALLLVAHPDLTGLRAFAKVVNQQNQNAKTLLYVAAFALILPLALIAVPRLVDRVAGGPNAGALPALAGGVAATFAATLIAVRLSARLPWGDGLGVLLVAVAAWSVLAGLGLARAARPPEWLALRRLAAAGEEAGVVAVGLVFILVLGATGLGSLAVIPLAAGALAVLGVVAGRDRLRVPHVGRGLGTAVDVVVVVLLLLAIPDTVIFHSSSAIPNAFLPPGIIQFQQDWILGPANQLLGNGGLMVNSPVSQYGVGMLYFLDGWFHIAPIGYGTFGFLDAILTALFYVAGYAVLRLARTPRLLAAAVLALGVVALIYNLHYPVGALPEQGPLRFGMPMTVILAFVVATRWPARARIARGVALVLLGIASIWALEAFGYTVLTFAAMTALEAAQRPRGGRPRWLLGRVGAAIAACVAAHLLFAGAILAGSGHLPDWSEYLAYLHALLLGGKEGSITYGFANWSPGLLVGAGSLASAAAIVLLVRRAPAAARRERLRLVALTGTTAYSIAVFSYTDNRSSTYLLAYTTLPLLLTAALWLSMILGSPGGISRRIRVAALAFCLSVAAVMIAAAWPVAGSHFSRSMLAHAYPGGGLQAALDRLWHPPPIDPRAPEGARLVTRYIPGRKPIVVLPVNQDLSVELLVRSGRSNGLFIGWGNMDSFVPSVWKPKIAQQIRALRPGRRVLIDRTALDVIATLRAHPSIDPIAHPVGVGTAQEEWILRELDQRFRLQPIFGDQQGFVVAQLVAR
jgi:hypothetical protein